MAYKHVRVVDNLDVKFGDNCSLCQAHEMFPPPLFFSYQHLTPWIIELTVLLIESCQSER